MRDLIHSGPTTATQALRALRRYPDRVAFVSENSSLSYRGAVDLIGRMQAVLIASGYKRGQRLAFLSANSAETWCAGIAARPRPEHHLAASAGRARRSPRGHRGCRGVGADRRSGARRSAAATSQPSQAPFGSL